ncbi:unnamed protein product [Larinioides sclopetarius]|uniref:Speckle-type POZ protein n=1 Tax=Larinioides sclopetarius TaxID=280406 RepID=A0AAV2AZN8_9ARAC
MELKKNSKNDCYSITWAIKNFSYCWQKKKKAIVSPIFCVNIPEETKWKLMLFPRGLMDGNFISIFLYRDKDCNFVGNIEVEYSLEILDGDGSALVTNEATYKFGKNERMGFSKVIRRPAIITEKNTYLPQDILTLRCRMKRFEEKIIQIQQIFAQTVINVERTSFVWRIEEFSKMRAEETKSFIIKSASGCQMIKIDLSLSNEQESEEKVILSTCSFERYLKFSSIKTFLIDSKKQKIDSGEFECLLESGKWLTFPLKMTKEMIMENENLYLFEDILSLYFEVATSTGILFEDLKNVKLGNTFHQITNEVVVNWRDFYQDENVPKDFSELKADLMLLYKEQNLCDMKLKTKTNNFHVHTSILGARSPVFRAMFSSDMKEKVNGCVNVSDLEDETVRRFLLYLYSDQLEDLQWDIALELYKAADKYAVISLREKCSTFLKNNLNLENSCEALALSDMHQDKDFKEIVQTFILKNAKVIFKSKEWKLLAVANSILAMETMLRNWNDD